MYKVSHWRRSGTSVISFEHTPRLALVFLLLTLSREVPAGLCSKTFLIPEVLTRFGTSMAIF